MSEVQKKMDALSQEVSNSIEKFERQTFRPMQKAAFLCSAKCCDSSANQQQLNDCIQGCQRTIHAAQQASNAIVQQFQERLQRCTVRCQDEAQEKLPTSPSEKQLDSARASLGKCLEGCADQYRKQVPKLISDMQAQTKQ